MSLVNINPLGMRSVYWTVYPYRNAYSEIVNITEQQLSWYDEGMEKFNNAAFGNKIEKLMQKNGLLQKDLAGTVGVDPASLSRIIAGEKKPSAELVANLATALHVTSDYLLDIENDGEFDLGKEIRVLARNKDKLTPEDKREIIELLVDL